MHIPLLTAENLLGPSAERLRDGHILDDVIAFHGDIERLPFMSLQVLKNVRSVLCAWDGIPNTARAWSPPSGPYFQLRPVAGQLLALYDAGYTIVLEDVERFVPELKFYCRSLERDLGVQPGKVNVEIFCAKAGGRGRPHFDPSFTFNCQITGSKAWRTVKSEAVFHPTFGMFLEHRPPLEHIAQISGSLPDNLNTLEPFIAQPGSVVLLPPGVLHQTDMLTDSYAIAFAIEHTETVATEILNELKRRISGQPGLRAARLGAQWCGLEKEAANAASVLRALADEVDRGTLRFSKDMHRAASLYSGLRIRIEGADEVMLIGTTKTKTLKVDEVTLNLLKTAASGLPFTLWDVLEEAPDTCPMLLHAALSRLLDCSILEWA